MGVYNLVSFAYDKTSGFFNVQIQYELSNEIQTDIKQFKQLGSADLYIKNSKKSWLLNVLENWLLDIKNILDTSPDERKKSTFKNVWLIYEEFINCELHIICERILKGEKYLMDLLPCQTDNNCHNLKRLEQLISFCKTEYETMKF